MSAEKGQGQADIRLIRFPHGVRYALLGMAFLAEQPDDGFQLVEDVAKARKLPKNYLSKIFQKLRHRGFLVSQRGPGGGYALARPARTIPLAAVMSAMEEPRGAGRECLLELRGCGVDRPCFLHDAVLRSERVLRECLAKASLADIAAPEDRHGHSE